MSESSGVHWPPYPSFVATVRRSPICETRCNRCAQIIDTWHAGAGSSVVCALRQPRRAGVTCSRNRWFGAKTPRSRVRLMRGRKDSDRTPGTGGSGRYVTNAWAGPVLWTSGLRRGRRLSPINPWLLADVDESLPGSVRICDYQDDRRKRNCHGEHYRAPACSSRAAVVRDRCQGKDRNDIWKRTAQ